MRWTRTLRGEGWEPQNEGFLPLHSALATQGELNWVKNQELRWASYISSWAVVQFNVHGSSYRYTAYGPTDQPEKNNCGRRPLREFCARGTGE